MDSKEETRTRKLPPRLQIILERREHLRVELVQPELVERDARERHRVGVVRAGGDYMLFASTKIERDERGAKSQMRMCIRKQERKNIHASPP